MSEKQKFTSLLDKAVSSPPLRVKQTKSCDCGENKT